MDSNRQTFSQRFSNDSQNIKRKLENLTKPNSSHTSSLLDSSNRLRNLSTQKVTEIEEASQQLKKLEDQLKTDEKVNGSQKKELHDISQQSDVPISELEKIMKQMQMNGSSASSSSFNKGNLQEMSERFTRETKKMEEVLKTKGKTVEENIHAKQADLKEATSSLAGARSVLGEASEVVKKFSIIPQEVEKKLSGMVGLVEGLKKLQSSLTDQTVKQRDTTKLMSYLHNGYSSSEEKSKDVWSSPFLDQVVQSIKEKELQLTTLFQQGGENRSPLEFVDSVIIDNQLYILAIKSPRAESSTFIYEFDLSTPNKQKELLVYEVKSNCIPYQMILKDGFLLISVCLPTSESTNLTDSLLGGKLNEVRQKPKAALLKFDIKKKETEIVDQFENHNHTIPFKLFNDQMMAIKRMDEKLNDFFVEVFDLKSKRIIWSHSTIKSKQILLDLFLYENEFATITKDVVNETIKVHHPQFQFIFDLIPQYKHYRQSKCNEKKNSIEILFENHMVVIDLHTDKINLTPTKAKSIDEFRFDNIHFDKQHRIINVYPFGSKKIIVGYVDLVPNELFSRQSFVKIF